MILFLMHGTEIVSEGTIEEIAKETNRTISSLNTLYRSTYSLNYKRKMKQHNRKYISLIKEDDLPLFLDNESLENQEWCMYKGEEVVAIGTIRRLSEITNKTQKTLKFYTSKSYKKRANKGKNRIHLIKLEGNENEMHDLWW